MAIVDYKTDSWSDESELDAKVERYRGQMRAYARAVRESVGRDVVGATLLFLNRDGAVGRTVNLSDSVSETSPHSPWKRESAASPLGQRLLPD